MPFVRFYLEELNIASLALRVFPAEKFHSRCRQNGHKKNRSFKRCFFLHYPLSNRRIEHRFARPPGFSCGKIPFPLSPK